MLTFSYLLIMVISLLFQPTEHVAEITIICTAESESIVSALSQTEIAGAWATEQMIGYCYKGILEQLETNLHTLGLDFTVVQLEPQAGWESQTQNSITMYTTMNVNGARMVYLTPDFEAPATLPSNFEYLMDPRVNLYVVSPSQKRGAANFGTGLIAYGQGECEVANRYFDAARQTDWQWYTYTDSGTDFGPLIQLGFYQANCAILKNDFGEAVDFLTAAFPTGWPENSKLLRVNFQGNLAFSYYQLGQSDNALKIMNQVVEATNELNNEALAARALSKRARLYMLFADYDHAVSDMSKAIELAPRSPDLYTLRGQIYLNIYEWDNSLEDYNAALELAPDYAEAWFQRGLLYYSILQTGQELREEALADFKTYLDLAPDGPHAEEARRYIESIEAAMAVLNE